MQKAIEQNAARNAIIDVSIDTITCDMCVNIAPLFFSFQHSNAIYGYTFATIRLTLFAHSFLLSNANILFSANMHLSFVSSLFGLCIQAFLPLSIKYALNGTVRKRHKQFQ